MWESNLTLWLGFLVMAVKYSCEFSPTFRLISLSMGIELTFKVSSLAIDLKFS